MSWVPSWVACPSYQCSFNGCYKRRWWTGTQVRRFCEMHCNMYTTEASQGVTKVINLDGSLV